MEETERIVSGYCRQLDQTRMVLCEYADGVFLRGDCAFPDCPFSAECTLASSFTLT